MDAPLFYLVWLSRRTCVAYEQTPDGLRLVTPSADRLDAVGQQAAARELGMTYRTGPTSAPPWVFRLTGGGYSFVQEVAERIKTARGLDAVRVATLDGFSATPTAY